MSDAPIRRPWLGDRWEETGLLILGESHYHFPGEDPEDAQKTIATVKAVMTGTRMRFFTAVERVVTGASLRDTDPSGFFQTIAFANFCQGSADGPAGAKTPEMWRRGIDALPIVLADLKPRRMLVFSSESWRRFKDLNAVSWQHERYIGIGSYKADTGFLSAADGSFRVLCMNVGHPSGRGWGGADGWSPFVREFLDHPIPA